jgi:EAL domain-containing protein (putative c-di-GMP-specific phosphodiesterase class I)/ActR/RegA family two-component response regulator
MSSHQLEQTLRFSIHKLLRVNRLYAMASRINRSVMRAQTPSDIYSAVCRIAVEEGNFRFALIALLDPQKRIPMVIASAGAALERHWLNLFECDEAQEVSCSAQHRIINDIRGNAHTAVHQNKLLEAGVLAVAFYPLFSGESTAGMLCVGMGEVNYFGEAEHRLLGEVSTDVSYALKGLQRDEALVADEAKLHYLTYYDAHTGLPGRPLFEERLAEMSTQQSVAVFVICLRNYQEIVQVLGFNSGVGMARTITTRIESELPMAISARIGESEFALALESDQEQPELEEIAWQIHRSITNMMMIEGQDVYLEAFIGIAMCPKGDTSEHVVKAALTAADRAQLDNNGCLFFASDMDNTSRQRLTLETALRHAVSHQEFVLYYQPQIDLASGRVTGAEALLRWQRPNCELVPPGHFITLLEETGLICAVGEWVLFEACRACHRWQKAGLAPVRIAVNLSGRQFMDTNIYELVAQTLLNTYLDPQWLELEVTESIILPNAASIIRTLHDLRTLGVSQTLDDFGTGYSSLSYLQRLPVERLKIDRSFVASITSNPNDAAIIRAVIGMAHSLNIKVVAEGVETQGQLRYLQDLNCNEMQGYYFSPPLPEADFLALLRDGRGIPIETRQSKQERVLLLVDDEPKILHAMKRSLKHTDIRVLTTTSPFEGFNLLATHQVGVIICDQRMPEMTGTEFLRRAKELFPTTVRIVLSGYIDLNSVIDAVNRGAIYKFLTKPLQNDILQESLEDAFHLHKIEWENHILSQQLQK